MGEIRQKFDRLAATLSSRRRGYFPTSEGRSPASFAKSGNARAASPEYAERWRDKGWPKGVDRKDNGFRN